MKDAKGLSKKQQRALNYIEDNGSISSKQALEELGDGRLSGTIEQLRKKGYNIKTVRVDTTNRYGESTWYGRYVLD